MGKKKFCKLDLVVTFWCLRLEGLAEIFPSQNFSVLFKFSPMDIFICVSTLNKDRLLELNINSSKQKHPNLTDNDSSGLGHCVVDFIYVSNYVT